MTLRYVSGPAHAVVRRGTVVMLEDNSDIDLVLRLWDELGQDSGLVEIIQVLTGAYGSKLSFLPPFAVVVVRDQQAHVAVRGEFSVALDVDGEERVHVDGMNVTTWSERVVQKVVDFAVRTGTARVNGPLVDDRQALPIEGGVVGAQVMGWQLAATLEPAEPVRKRPARRMADADASAASSVGGEAAGSSVPAVPGAGVLAAPEAGIGAAPELGVGAVPTATAGESAERAESARLALSGPGGAPLSRSQRHRDDTLGGTPRMIAQLLAEEDASAVSAETIRPADTGPIDIDDDEPARDIAGAHAPGLHYADRGPEPVAQPQQFGVEPTDLHVVAPVPPESMPAIHVERAAGTGFPTGQGYVPGGQQAVGAPGAFPGAPSGSEPGWGSHGHEAGWSQPGPTAGQWQWGGTGQSDTTGRAGVNGQQETNGQAGWQPRPGEQSLGMAPGTGAPAAVNPAAMPPPAVTPPGAVPPAVNPPVVTPPSAAHYGAPAHTPAVNPPAVQVSAVPAAVPYVQHVSVNPGGQFPGQPWPTDQGQAEDRGEVSTAAPAAPGMVAAMPHQWPSQSGAVDHGMAPPPDGDQGGEEVVDHDGHTVMSAAVADMRAAPKSRKSPGAAARSGGQQHILARTCPQGHANPPSRERCAVCDALLEGDADLAIRPPLGRILLSTGQVVRLDRGVIVGRRPRAPRGQGADLPHLVTVPSPQNDISRSHVEVRLEGWHVLVSDMKTTNGTTLQRIGQPPRRLHPSEQVLVADGDIIDMGDGVTMTFEGLR